jgi:hypothetical protein
MVAITYVHPFEGLQYPIPRQFKRSSGKLPSHLLELVFQAGHNTGGALPAFIYRNLNSLEAMVPYM